MYLLFRFSVSFRLLLSAKTAKHTHKCTRPVPVLASVSGPQTLLALTVWSWGTGVEEAVRHHNYGNYQ